MTQSIRLCTWNIQLGLRLETILKEIRRHADFDGLDLFMLQEASLRHERPDADFIAAALGSAYEGYQVTAHFLNGRAQANALIWNTQRVQVVNKDWLRLPHTGQARGASPPERVLLRVLPRQPRLSLVVEGVIGSETLRVYVTHLDVVGFAHKRQQFSSILEDARARPPARLTVIAGDLNTFKIRSRPSWARIMHAANAAGFQDLTRDIRWTHSIARLRMRQKLDAIFVRYAPSHRARTWTLDIPGSDHIPVFAEIVRE